MSDYEQDTDRAAHEVLRRVAAGERLGIPLCRNVIDRQDGQGTPPRPTVVLLLATSLLSGEVKGRRSLSAVTDALVP